MIEASFYPRINTVSSLNKVSVIQQISSQSVVARGGDAY